MSPVPPPARLLFQEDKFLAATRAKDIALVEKVIARVDQPNQPRTIVIREEIGSGKTWLVFYLKRRALADNPNVIPLLILFTAKPDEFQSEPGEYFIDPGQLNPDKSPEEIEAVLAALLQWLAAQVGAETAPGSSLDRQIKLLVNGVEKNFHERVLVLLLDSIFEIHWEILPRLEALLAPLAALPHVVMVLTGRGRLYPWESPFLRANVAPFQDWEDEYFEPLPPFEPNEIKQQLDKQLPNHTLSWAKIEEIKQLGGGYPWSNYLLGLKLNENKDKGAALKYATEQLLPIEDPQALSKVRDDLSALSVLQGFRETEMPDMWIAFKGEGDPEAITKPEIRERRDLILDYYLMQWREGRYVIDKPIRLILDNNLKYNDTPTWQRLHCTAQALYNSWADEFAKYREQYRDRAQYHQQALETARDQEPQLNVGECPHEHAAELEETFPFHSLAAPEPESPREMREMSGASARNYG